MFQATRRRLALWYTAVTAILLLLFASGVYFYVRTTLVERVDDTLNHVVEIVERSLVIESGGVGPRVLTSIGVQSPPMQVNVEASFRNNAQAVEADHIDLEWFGPTGQLLWSTFTEPLPLSLHVNPAGETVHLNDSQVLRQMTQRVQLHNQILGYLRVSHPWFEVTKPSRQLIVDLSAWSSLIVLATAMIGWFLSGLAMAPVLTSYQQLKQFTADASHELRNPIAVIQTNVQVALSDPEPDIILQQAQLQVIERLTRRLGRLVDNLLFLTRQDSGLIPTQHDPLDLRQLLQEVIEEQQVIAQEKQIQIRYQVGDSSSDLAPFPGPETPGADTYTLKGDRDQLMRLLTNLVANAIQYTLATGQVEIRLASAKYQGQPAYRITLQDTGIGIAIADQVRIFDRFYRVDPARSRGSQQEGSGLGLAIAKAIVDNHGGHLSLTSQEGQGTTFTVLLPQGKL